MWERWIHFPYFTGLINRFFKHRHLFDRIFFIRNKNITTIDIDRKKRYTLLQNHVL